MGNYRSITKMRSDVTITVDGNRIGVPHRQSLLAALLVKGATGEARDFHCAIGQCQRCLVRVNGRVETACLYIPKDGDSIDTSGA